MNDDDWEHFKKTVNPLKEQKKKYVNNIKH